MQKIRRINLTAIKPKYNISHIESSHKGKLLLLLLVFLGFILLLGADMPFFWDCIQLGSKHAYYFYENSMVLDYLPDSINSGHIPAFGYYLAAYWTLFGKSLMVSHLSMWPFVFTSVIVLWKLFDQEIENPYLLFFGVIVCLMDPTLMTQLLMVSPDVVLICGFLLVLYGYRINHSWLQAIGFLLLALISIRGIALAGIIGLWMLSRSKSLKSLILISLPSIGAVMLYYLSHYFSQGWIGVHSDSPWQASISFASLEGMAKNVVVMIWRIVDFGRVCWICLFLLFLYRSRRLGHSISGLISLLPYLIIGFGLLTIPFVALTGHRYYLPIILLGLIGTVSLITQSKLTQFRQTALLVAILIIQLLSHRIVYPDSISQGWDSSLAYVPYIAQVDIVEDYLVEQGIPCAEVGTYFPLRGNSEYRDLDDRDCNYQAAEIGQHKYLITSNIMNDLKSIDQSLIEANYNRMESWKNNGVYLHLYQLK